MKAKWITSVTVTLLLNCSVIGAAQIIERGPHHRVVAHGEGSRYTELRNGMHYFENGEWRETEEELLLTNDGAEALKGPHKIKLSRSLRKAGAVDITTADGQRLRATFIGVRYFDASSGKYAPLGWLKDSTLEVLPPNRAIYRDVCDGVSADLLLTYTSGGLESDLILREAPPSPIISGLDPDSTRLEVLKKVAAKNAPL